MKSFYNHKVFVLISLLFLLVLACEVKLLYSLAQFQTNIPGNIVTPDIQLLHDTFLSSSNVLALTQAFTYP